MKKILEHLRKKSTSEITAEEWEFLRNAGVCNGCGGNCENTKNTSSLPLFLDEKWSKIRYFATPHDFENCLTTPQITQTGIIKFWSLLRIANGKNGARALLKLFVAQTVKITSWLVEKKQKGICRMQKFLARLLSPLFFEASCDKHDFGYWKGGDEARRKECDEKFLEAILRDIEKIPHSPFIKGAYKGIAYLFYFAVRIGGRKYFNFINKK